MNKRIRRLGIFLLACYVALLGLPKGRLFAIKSGRIRSIRVDDPAALLAAAAKKYAARELGDIVQDIEAFRRTLGAAREDAPPGDELEPNDGQAYDIGDLVDAPAASAAEEDILDALGWNGNA